MKLELERRTLRLARPLETSYGEVRERELAIVAVSDEEGPVGYGEADTGDALHARAVGHDQAGIDPVQRPA